MNLFKPAGKHIPKENILITGATGFIGKRLVAVLSASDADIFVLARNWKKAKELKTQFPKIKIICGDLKSPDQYMKYLSSINTVYHIGAKTGIWGDREEFEKTNYYGTKNLVDAAEKHGVKRFVYYSTQNVCYRYGFLTPQSVQDQNSSYLDENEYNDFYSLSKAKAEKYVLAKNKEGFFTTAIRPGWAWGPGDTNLFSNIVAMTQKKLVVMVGGKACAALSHVDNINHAAVLAGQNPQAGGKAFYVTDDHPITVNNFIYDLLDAAELPFPNVFMPYFTAYPLAAVTEFVYRVLKLKGRPPLTRFDVYALAKDMLIDISASKKILGYQPIVSYSEGMRQFKEWWKETGRNLYEKENSCSLKLRKMV